ncbi:N,N-dimethylformamidase beta subunit [Novipirellula galeiformis]|uniref:N,N-dimethylformamidase beta subunit n=1 Tax=Novipirellula galeiformis TaxID=2528004 RepID=A0A5C6BZQ5_9BACT|nr:N,N-dimethylformamidase beta subunit family domain-containing protein [Novipirellula galeiformis]TWU17342.1 N,N-dimethylformamidase beta subunit [Novipirellula galeiformis]
MKLNGLVTSICIFVAIGAARAGADQVQPAAPFVLGYANQVSVAAGEEISFHVSASGDAFDMRVERVGAERTKVLEKSQIACATHPIPDRASSHGCNWPAALTITVPPDWASGYYEATLTLNDGEKPARSSLFFIVRSAEAGKNTKILLELGTNTYNAYTNWGGHSLYGYHDRDGIQGHRVSFDRPLNSLFSKWELPFVKWAEQNGYTLDYASNCDLEFHPEILKQYNLVLSVGHDEYWSSPMRDHLEQYITDGGNVAFLTGNTCCWQVRSEDNGRALTCWKQSFNSDPLYRTSDHKLLSTAWSHHLIGRPENELTGLGFLWGGYHRSHGQFMDGSGAFRVHRPEHWLFEGTDLKREDQFGGEHSIVGYECDGCEIEWADGLPFATHRDGTPESFTILATCPARWAPGDCFWYDRFPTDRVGNAVFGTYTRGGTVVSAGTTDWAHGLAGNDPNVVRITRNILDRLSAP